MLTAAKLTSILSVIDVSRIGNEILEEFKEYIDRVSEMENREAEEKRRREEAVPLEVPDFSKVKVGTLVVRSEHSVEQSCGRGKDDIGIITDFKICEDDLCGFIHWPVIHWEGSIMSTMCHPINVACRDGRSLPKKTMNNNQLAKKSDTN